MTSSLQSKTVQWVTGSCCTQPVPDDLNPLKNRRFRQVLPTAYTVNQLIFLLLSVLLLLVCSLAKPALSGPLSPAPLPPHHQNIVNDFSKLITPVAVFGKDQRQRLPRRYKALGQQIGLLHNPKTNTLCTAFCVGPDMIATASHCLFSHRKKRKLHLSSFLFKLNTRTKNKPFYSKLAGNRTRQTRQFIITGTSKLNRKPPIGAARDWAIIRLEHASCRNGWLKTIDMPHNQLELASRNKKLFQVAYHMDYRNWQIAYSRSCSINRSYGGLKWRNIKKHFATPQSLILHQCDTGEASSGSPLLMDTFDGPVVVGINVGTYQQRDIIVKSGRVIRRTKYRTIANTAVSSAAFLRNISLLKQADVIHSSADMKDLQLNLQERNYYQGSIDGIYGSRTELAIKAFEQGMNRPITGLATSTLLAEFNKNNTDPLSIETSGEYELPTAPTTAD
jgi:V8-like Glu-specific endopeptidase